MVLESNTLDYIFLQDGENGVGIPGKDGKTLYTWVKYSQNADGSNMSDSPENALYIGIAYNKDSATESTNPEDYKWTKIKGEQGLPGTDAYTIILSNESHTFSGNTTSAIPASTKCHVIAYKGTQQLAVTIGMISDLPEGMTAPISNNGTTNAYFSPTVTSLMITKNGTLTIPITVDGKVFTKYFSYSLALQGNNGISATNIILSNESHTFSANASGQADATSINIDIMGYTGSTQVNTQIGKIFGLPTGMTMKINNNGTVNSNITVSVTSSLTTSQGVVIIPITANGITVEKSFSYALSKTGVTGAAAKSIYITASSQVFKSTDGGTTFSPDTIKLTPVFQGGITYSKWQYSVNGGSSWTDVTSGSHGLTISSGVLSIAKTSDLFTDTVTSISFKCISNNSTYYDIMTVLKLYDVTGLQDDLEDLQNQITTITNTMSGVKADVDAANKAITDEVWKSTIIKTTDAEGNEVSTSIEDLLINHTTDLNGIHSEISNVQTTVSKKADGSTVQTLSTKVATMESDFNGFKTTVSNTYTTKEDFNNLEIGGRNLARKTSNEYCAAFNSFNGNDNICPSLARVYLKGLSVGDKVTVRLVYKYTNIVAVTGKTAASWLQGSGNITVWTSGTFGNSTSIVLSGSGEKIIKYSFVITSDMIKNQYWDVSIRHDGIQSGSVQWKEFKVEKGNIATDWTPAPEDVEQSITNVSSQYTQLADKFNWIVKSGTSSSDFTITDRMISLTSSALNIDALTTFKNSAENGSSTVINGGAIKANTITTSKLATDAIKSTNYAYSSGNFSSAGTFLDLSTGLVRSKNFAIDSSGSAYFKGNIQANAGYIGGTSGWAITTNTITGNANSKIISGILQSSNYVENSTGVQVNLNTGIIKGNIEASTLAAKEAIKIYVGSTKRNVITGHLESDFFYVRIGCDLSTSNIARVKPSIILNKSTASTNVSDMITINTEALDIYANTTISGSLVANDLLTNGVINTSGNNVYCNDVQTRTGWTADRLSHGETAYSNLMSGRISFKWVQNSSGVWRIYVYVDGALVRDW